VVGFTHTHSLTHLRHVGRVDVRHSSIQFFNLMWLPLMRAAGACLNANNIS
jgi:hypothetical protein